MDAFKNRLWLWLVALWSWTRNPIGYLLIILCQEFCAVVQTSFQIPTPRHEGDCAVLQKQLVWARAISQGGEPVTQAVWLMVSGGGIWESSSIWRAIPVISFSTVHALSLQQAIAWACTMKSEHLLLALQFCWFPLMQLFLVVFPFVIVKILDVATSVLPMSAQLTFHWSA